MFQSIALFLAAIAIVFISGCSNEDESASLFTTSGMVVDVPNGVPQNLSTLSSAKRNFGLRGETEWDFVRGSATWGDANSQTVDQILVALLNSGLLQLNGTFLDTSSTINGLDVTIRLTTNDPTTVSTATAFSGSRTYSRKFEIWRNSDGAKGLEMYFDSATTLGDDGVLLYYQLNILDEDNFDGDNVIVESFTQQTSEGRKQTYSWSGGSITAGGPAQAGRVILEQMDSDTIFCFKSVIKFADQGCGTGADDYYSLGYTQNLTGNGEVTAKFGFADNGIDNTGTICGVPNGFNYGTFNSAGFLGDGSSTVGASFPSTTRVDSLFSEIDTAGAGTWDDLQQVTIDGLNVQFVDSSTAPSS